MALSLSERTRIQGSLAERILFGLFVALLAWIPIPLGSNFVGGWSALELGAFVLMIGWLVLWAAGRARVSSALARSSLPLLLLAPWVAWEAAYVIPLPPSIVAVLSPEAARIHGLAASIGAGRETITLSVDQEISEAYLLKTLAYAAIFVLTLALANSTKRIRVLAAILVFSALVHSVYAVLMHLAGAQITLFNMGMKHGPQAIGFFLNRNHFAGYLEMTLALGIGLLIAGLTDRRAENWKQFLRQTLDWLLSPKMVLRLALCVLVIALTTTHSRLGNMGFFASLFVAGVIGIILSRHATRNTVLLLASLVIIDLAIVGSWFGVEQVVQRLERTTSEEVVERETPAAQMPEIIRRHPVFGMGPGTFYVAFEPYRPEKVVDYYDFAHNDYAQFAVESGLVGIGVLGVFVVATLAAALRAQAIRRNPLMRGMSFACVMGVTAILIHSTGDYNLQIPANAAYFMVLLALGWISLYHDRHERRPE